MVDLIKVQPLPLGQLRSLGLYLLSPARDPSLTGGVCAMLDTPLKFNHHVAEAELSYVLLSELVHLNIALRASCAVSCPVALRACCTASEALVPVRGARREPSPFVHAARHPRP